MVLGVMDRRSHRIVGTHAFAKPIQSSTQMQENKP